MSGKQGKDKHDCSFCPPANCVKYGIIDGRQIHPLLMGKLLIVTVDALKKITDEPDLDKAQEYAREALGLIHG